MSHRNEEKKDEDDATMMWRTGYNKETINEDRFNEYLNKPYNDLLASIKEYNDIKPRNGEKLEGRMDAFIKEDYIRLGCNHRPTAIEFTNFETYIIDVKEKYIKIRNSFIKNMNINISYDISVQEFKKLIVNPNNKEIFEKMYNVQLKLIALATAYRNYQNNYCNRKEYPNYDDYDMRGISNKYKNLGGRKSKKRTAKSSK